MESQSSNGDPHNYGNHTDHANHAGDRIAFASSGPSFATWQSRSLSHAECTKVASIATACESTQPIERLTALATSRAGLVDDEVRRMACESMTTLMLWWRLMHHSRANSAWLPCEDYGRGTILSSMARTAAP